MEIDDEPPFHGITEDSAPLTKFILELWDTGRVVVPDVPDSFNKADREAAWSRLQAVAEEERAFLPGTPPALSQTAAEWALVMFFRSCRFLVHRHQNQDDMRRTLSLACPELPTPSVCYSVDLTFRFLFDLQVLAKAASLDDPLNNVLAQWGIDWPLSSVGMDLSQSTTSSLNSITWDVDSWWLDPCLRLTYVDRILAREDVTRIADCRVAQAVRVALGDHCELSPKMTSALRSSLVGASQGTCQERHSSDAINPVNLELPQC